MPTQTYHIYDVEREVLTAIRATNREDALKRYLKHLNPDFDASSIEAMIDDFNGYIISPDEHETL